MQKYYFLYYNKEIVRFIIMEKIENFLRIKFDTLSNKKIFEMEFNDETYLNLIAMVPLDLLRQYSFKPNLIKIIDKLIADTIIVRIRNLIWKTLRLNRSSAIDIINYLNNKYNIKYQKELRKLVKSIYKQVKEKMEKQELDYWENEINEYRSVRRMRIK